jgi:hypothetical protein
MQVRDIAKAAKAARVVVPIILIGVVGCTTFETYSMVSGNVPKNEGIIKNAQMERIKTYTKVTENLEKPRSYFVNFLNKSNKLNPWEIQDILHSFISGQHIASQISAYHAIYSVDGSFCEVDFLSFKNKKEAREYMESDINLLYAESKVKKYNGYKRCFRINDTRHQALEWVSDTSLLKIMWQRDAFGDFGPNVSNLIDDFLEKYPPGAK